MTKKDSRRQQLDSEKPPTNSSKKALPAVLVIAGIAVLLYLSGGFLYRILAIYLLPNTYMCLRLRKLFGNRTYRRLFTVFFILAAASFPITELVSHATGLAWLRHFLIIGYYSLPFLLYLFLLVLLFDVLLGLNRLLKLAPKEFISSGKFRLASLCIMFALAAAVVIKGHTIYDNTQVNEYRIEVPRKSSGIKRLRIALAADFHLGALTSKKFMRGFVAKINSLNPDIVLIPGDVLEGDRDDVQTAEFERQFRQVRARYGLYASPGNHESHGANSKLDFFNNANTKMLRDAYVVVDGSFCIAGRNDTHGRRRKSIAELLQGVPDGLPVILLDHRPIDLGLVSNGPVDIQVSAHTHHGQLFPFNFITAKQYEVSWGYKKIGHTHFFVTCGIQAWGPRIRTAGVSEIMLIDVAFKEN